MSSVFAIKPRIVYVITNVHHKIWSRPIRLVGDSMVIFAAAGVISERYKASFYSLWFTGGAITFEQQLAILRSAEARFTSSLFDIRQMMQADVFDSEIEAAEELAKKNFTRASGAMAGVVLERHLAQVAENHKVTIRRIIPGISDLNDALKKEEVIDVPQWRSIQYLGDIRNLCDHSKEREPAQPEVNELIAGVKKLTKTLF